jgi:hypothetical protein
MRISRTALATAAFVALSLAPVYAQGRGGGHAKAPTSSTSTRGNPHTKTSTASTSTTTAPTTTTPPATPPLNPIAQKITSHPHLAAKVNALLLPTGMTLNQASAGFKNRGQFMAALHVSRNLHIPFADLKSAMLGTKATSTTPGTPPMSLGQAIHKLRPRVDADDAAEHATEEAEVEIRAGGTATTTTTTRKTGK